MSWSLRSIALTREYCTPKFLPGNCGGQSQGGSAAAEATIPAFRPMRPVASLRHQFMCYRVDGPNELTRSRHSVT